MAQFSTVLIAPFAIHYQSAQMKGFEPIEKLAHDSNGRKAKNHDKRTKRDLQKRS